ncbi:MAG: hypothetical protein EOR86_13270 [Mesorhizobium sp.]|uniref:hypothetical protein n=1 Tax=Mesorhizobium sp. TaxID=1871066 RepID=UPI000FE683E6|nr:hypothetical protein [Mesorhizobium sp.]RWM96173.1 MAG: hypothetical protein EOR86_13270 [Mesorhizobium sp.]
MPVLLKFFEDPSNIGVTASRDDGRNASFFIPKRLEGSNAFGPLVKRLRETTSNTAAVAASQLTDLSAEGWKKQFPATVRPLAAPWQQLQGGAMDNLRQLDMRRADLLSNGPKIPPGTTDGEKLRLTFSHDIQNAQTVAMLTPMQPSALISAVIGNRELGSLALATPSLRAKLPGDIVERLEQDVMERTLADQYARQLPKVKPSYEAPLADAPDVDAAKAAARQAMAAFDVSRDEIAAVEMVLKSAVDFVAILGDVSRAEAFGLLNG